MTRVTEFISARWGKTSADCQIVEQLTNPQAFDRKEFVCRVQNSAVPLAL